MFTWGLTTLAWMLSCGHHKATDGDRGSTPSESSSVCGGSDELFGAYGTPYFQRACCLHELNGNMCEEGFFFGPSLVVDEARSFTCDVSGSSHTRDACRCSGGADYATGACMRANSDPVVKCTSGLTRQRWDSETEVRTVYGRPDPHAMSLFVTGLNHRRAFADQFVDQSGVNQLADAIVGSTVESDSIVVAVSGTGAPDNMACNGGAVSAEGDDNYVQNGECLAHALHIRTGLPFKYTAWHSNVFAKYHGGFAVITGPRWKPAQGTDGTVGTHVYDSAGEEAALEVRLFDTKHPGTYAPIYVVHTGAPLRNTVGQVVKYAKDHFKAGDMAPLFVGDYNWAFGDDTSDDSFRFLAQDLDWLEYKLACDGHAFAREYDIMHVASGTSGTPDGYDFDMMSGMFSVTAFKYSRMSNGKPTSGIDGIFIPEIGHAVAGMDLGYPWDDCPAGQTWCGECVNVASNNDHCGSCGISCQAEGECQGSLCIEPPPECRGVYQFWCACSGKCEKNCAACNVACGKGDQPSACVP